VVTRSRVTARHCGGNAILKEATLYYALRTKLPVVSYEDTWKARTHETGGIDRSRCFRNLGVSESRHNPHLQP
jgi:hypothetical protein